MSVDQLWSALLQGSPVVLTAGLWALVTGRIVPRYVLDEAVRERESWKKIALDALHVTTRSLDKRDGPGV